MHTIRDDCLSKPNQDVLEMDSLRNECFHLILYWIQYWERWSATAQHQFKCVQPTSATVSVGSNSNGDGNGDGSSSIATSPSDALFHELILFLGSICLDNPQMAEMVRYGSVQGPVMLKRLCSLPFAFYVRPELQRVLFPTLAILTVGDEANRGILEEDMSVEMIAMFLRQTQRHHKAADVSGSSGHRMDVGVRMPRAMVDAYLATAAAAASEAQSNE
ncbi:hypothetical protein BC831DRAFT_138521 [Entophlyctis helioformis]|nr:hypothetical protein BC831DRAFT_138521 [Entophlyctis helioformis]